MGVKKYIKKILPSLIITLLIILIVYIGSLQLKVVNFAFSTVEATLKDVAETYTEKLFISQSSDTEVEELFEQMHSEVIFRLEARIGNKVQKNPLASYIMAFAIISTLGDNRVDNSNLTFYLLYATIGGIFYLLGLGLLITYLNRFIGSFFVSGVTDFSSICQVKGTKSDISQEYLLAHLERQRQKSSQGSGFGGNKELFPDESYSVVYDIQPASAMLLIFLLMLILVSILWILIMQTDSSFIDSILLQYRLCFAITMPKSMYIKQTSVTDMIYFLVNVYIGNIIVAVTVSQIGITFYQYFSGFLIGTLPKNYYEEFDTSPLWKDYTSYEARMKNVYPLIDNCKNENVLRKRHKKATAAAQSNKRQTNDVSAEDGGADWPNASGGAQSSSTATLDKKVKKS